MEISKEAMCGALIVAAQRSALLAKTERSALGLLTVPSRMAFHLAESRT
jgi:hypothetical protein